MILCYTLGLGPDSLYGCAMLKYLPKETLAQWAVGTVVVAGAASIAYVVIFPSDSLEPDLVLDPPRLVLVEPGAVDLPAEEPAPEVQVAMALDVEAMAPRFDIVRVTDLGDVLIAGKAPPTSAVSALIDEDPVAQTISTGAGEFVLMFEVAPSPAPRVLELEVRLPSGDRVRSVDTLMLAPRSEVLAGQSDALGSPRPTQIARPVEVEPLFPNMAPPTQPLLAAPQGAGETPGAETAIAELPEGSAERERPSAAPLAMLLRADGTVTMLGEAPRLPQQGASVSIDAVVYDDDGDVSLSGRSRGTAEIQIYLDNQPIIRARASADGNWQAQLAGIERGVYRLRVDELDEAAIVTSRAEIPFERVTPQIARDAGGPQALIVQPGNTLWGMAVEQYGDGRRYMRIFDANRDQIRNPNLIYPGQVYVLPRD